MGKIAFLFAGQGAQYPGMGKSLWETSPAARKVFDMADTLRPETSTQCFEGPEEDLFQTENTQPCLYCVDLAAALALDEAGVKADCAAGFSLGEMAALAYAGVFSHKDGFILVEERGQSMANAAARFPSSMVAVLKLPKEEVEALSRQYTTLWPVNYNCPGQLVVSGEKEQLKEFCARVEEKGGRTKMLSVSGGFHCPYMDPAVYRVRKIAEGMEFVSPKIPVYSNYSGRVYEAGEEKETMLAQINNAVYWQNIIERMGKAGVDTFIECGPGKTLSGFVKRTLSDVNIFHVEDEATLKETVEALHTLGY